MKISTRISVLDLLCGLLMIALFAIHPADAQAPSPSPEPQASQPAPLPTPVPTVRYYLEVDQSDLNAISAGLMELPKKIADPLIIKLQAQLKIQDDIRTAAKRAEASDPVERSKKREKK